MSERTRCYVYIEGDPGDVLFQLPRLSRRMSEGDTFTVTFPDDSAVTYRVETVNYQLKQLSVGDSQNVWTQSSVGYGVTIVP